MELGSCPHTPSAGKAGRAMSVWLLFLFYQDSQEVGIHPKLGDLVAKDPKTVEMFTTFPTLPYNIVGVRTFVPEVLGYS